MAATTATATGSSVLMVTTGRPPPDLDTQQQGCATPAYYPSSARLSDGRLVAGALRDQRTLATLLAYAAVRMRNT